jgi:hypothetical protein
VRRHLRLGFESPYSETALEFPSGVLLRSTQNGNYSERPEQSMTLCRAKMWACFVLYTVIFLLILASTSLAPNHTHKPAPRLGLEATDVPSVAGRAGTPATERSFASVSPRVHADASYTVEFTETGLPFGMGVPDNGPDITWTVQLGSLTGQATATSSSSSINFTGAANGTYPYNIPGVASNYGVSPSTPSFGNVTVGGGDVSIDVSFSYSADYSVTFIANGLGNGGNWSVTFNGVTTKVNPLVDTINVGGSNGTYRYSISSVPGFRGSPSAGLATVAGKWLNITVTWTHVLYAVTFNETGPTGGQWGVGLMPPKPPTMDYGGGTENSTGSTITFLVSNGTYSFLIDTSGSYLPTPGSGAVTVNGGPENESIAFTRAPPGEQFVTFSENGLPVGSNWSVILNGTRRGSTDLTISFSEKNGTYPVSVPSVDGLGPSPANGTISVPGNNGTFTISFLPVYAVTFTESDLPSGTNWSVSVTENSSESVLLSVEHPDGATFETVTHWSNGLSSVRFYLSNGSYSYSSSAPGQTGNSAPLNVNGEASAPVGLTFHPTPPTGTLLGEPYWVFAVIGGIIVVVLAALLVARRGRKANPSEASLKNDGDAQRPGSSIK